MNKFLDNKVIWSFVFVAALFLFSIIILSVFAFIIGLWEGNVSEIFIESYNNAKLNYKKLMSIYLILSIIMLLIIK